MPRLPSVIPTLAVIQLRRDWQYGFIVSLMLLLRFEAAAQPIPLRYGQASSAAKSIFSLPIFVGEREGFFRRAGLNFKIIIPLPGGSDKMIDALHVLVAEDNEVNQILVRAALAGLGHSCDVVADGAAAVARVKACHYDLVLMDIQMPNVDGIEAARMIRALGGAVGRVPIIALTANAMVEDRQAYLEAGMDGHVAKPFEPIELARVIASVIAKSASR